MKYTEEQFLNALGVSALHENFFEDYEQSMAEYDLSGVFFLADSFIEGLQNAWGFLNEKYDFVMRELRSVRENDLAARYSFLLYKMLLRNVGSPRITLLETPCFADTDTTVDFEMAAYFSLLAFAPHIISCHKKRDLPKQIIIDTLEDCFEGVIKLRNITHGRDGFDDKIYFSWNQLYVDCSIIRIGVLNFKMNQKLGNQIRIFVNAAGEYKMLSNNQEMSADGFVVAGSAGYLNPDFVAEYFETETEYVGFPVDTVNAGVERKSISLKKSEWSEILSEGDGVAGVHIPNGAAITPENCTIAYRSCFEIAKKYFPEYNIKAISCQSWLLDPTIARLVKKSSNIVRFGSQYMRYPTRSSGTAVFMFLFRRPYEKLEDLPENTSLERAIKAHYLDGKYIYEAGGVIFEDAL